MSIRAAAICTAIALGVGFAPVSASASTPGSDCSNAIWITEGSYDGSNTGSDRAPDEICGLAAAAGDVWYEYLAPMDGILNIEVKGSATHHVISVWENCPGGGPLLVCRDDGTGMTSIAGAVIREGVVYQIRVGAVENKSDEFLIRVDFLPSGSETFGGNPGADVVFTDIQSTWNAGAVSGVRGYALSSHTCNLGASNLRWGGSWQGSPSLAMNAYRLHNGRLLQIGLGFCKQACCAAAGSGCGMSCNGVGGSMLGSGCLDFYGASYNGGQSRLAPRSYMNPWTGSHQLAPTSSGNATFKRLQILEDDMRATNYPGALYFVEGVYVASDDAESGNRNNNASYRRVNVSQTTFDLSTTDTTQQYVPAIKAWRQHGLGANQQDTRVVDGFVDVPNEGRFWYAHKVTDLGNNMWRYDYAVFNLSSDRAAGSLSIPIPANTQISNVGFHDVDYHSGEVYDNADWVSSVSANEVRWSSPQTFAQNPNTNALRWGTMYNFWFDANRAPETGQATIGLFKPHTPGSIAFNAPVPAAPGALLGDMNCDGVVSPSDISAFVMALTKPGQYAIEFPNCNILNGDTNGDGVVSPSDIAGFMALLNP